MSARIGLRSALAVSGCIFLAGCEEGFQLPFGQGAENETTTGATADAAGASAEMVERDVEVPEVFQVAEAGLWDGRPSLGGVWVAHPDVSGPERVIIRNPKNDTTVIGALFKRERLGAGPVLQVSSDAAVALEMLAGQPTQLSVTALRREEVPVAPLPLEATTLAETETIEATTLDPIASAAAALDEVDAEKTATAASPGTAPKPRPVPSANLPVSAVAAAAAAATPAPDTAAAALESTQASAATGLAEPFIQIGIFSVEENAQTTATDLRQSGVIPTIKKQSSQGKTFWRVLVGPASNSAERNTLLKKVKAVGFADAYFVAN